LLNGQRSLAEWRQDIQQKFLKSIGAADAKLGENWLTDPWGPSKNRLDLLDRVHFAKNKRPTGVHEGDALVYYAAGWERIFGVAIVTSEKPYELVEDDQKRWPWTLNVVVPVVVPRLSLAPGLAEIKVANTSVRQQSHIRLTDEQYLLALAALTRRVQP
jgi:hypothetical protein